MNESQIDAVAWLSLANHANVNLASLGLNSDDTAGICVISGDTVIFNDPEEAVKRAIRHIQRSAITPLIDTPSAMFEELQRFWLEAGTNRSGNLHGQALAILHNTGTIDGLQVAVHALECGADVFTVSRMMVDSLPLFDHIDVPSLLLYCSLTHPRMKNDLMQGLPYNAAEQWMQKHPAHIGEVVRGCLAIPSEPLAPLLRAALVQGAVVERAPWLARIHELAEDQEPMVSLPAIEALGLVDWKGAPAEDLARAVAVVRTGLQATEDRLIISSAITALNLVSSAPEQNDLIDEIATLNQPYVVRLIGDHLAYRGEHLKSHPWYRGKIALLASKTNQNQGSYGGVDSILTGLFQTHESPFFPQQWLDTWALSNLDDTPSVPKVFPQLFEKLSGNSEELGILLARWLMHEKIGMQRMVRNIFDELGLRNNDMLSIPKSVLDALAPAQLQHLLRRILANVFREEQQLSLVWSLTKADSAETRTYSLVYEAMADFVGYDYPSAVSEHLDAVRAREQETPLGQLAMKISARMKTYYDALDELPTIEELRPTGEARHRFAKERQRGIQQALEDARRDSIWRQIATTIPLKAGRSSFSMRDGKPGEKMQLSSMSHAMSLPRSEAIDTVGSNMRRLHFKMSNLGDDE